MYRIARLFLKLREVEHFHKKIGRFFSIYLHTEKFSIQDR